MMILAAAFVTSCSDDDSLASRGLETVEMPISISIPAEGFVNPTDVGIGNEEPASTLAVTRALGDPGEAETFALPKYLYIYLVSTSSSNSTQVIFKKQEVKSEDWKLSTSGDNTNGHFSAKDGLYVYQGHLSINLPLNRKEGRVYVVASNLDLDDSGSANPKYKLVTDVSSWSSSKEVEDGVTFTNQSELRNNMQNLYSSPYNLENDGNYYGTIKDYASNVPHIDMVLYHVATKVDLQWTIDEKFQGTKAWKQEKKESNGSKDTMRSTTDNTSEDYNKVFFSFIEARLLPKEELPIFKPMNVIKYKSTFDAAFLGEEKYTGKDQPYTDSKGNAKTRKEYYQVLPEAEKSGMYYGRKVIYVMPELVTPSPGDYYYDITLKILVNNYTTSEKKKDGSYSSLLTEEDHATTGHHARIKIKKSDLNGAPKGSDGYPIFTPWIRATIHVNTVKDVENIVKFTDPNK
ncbi:hypothetical protein CIK94_11065 [Prevotella sp. P4-51]|uniref:hypothetical protein n=1 Tax=unclassified Prevotella TaxID=2638335 RepID=UPI000B96171F|nr:MULTISPECIES: hypothetical protein [unclassified Prevotella]OYP66842.1 hypothetical protein CIK87_10205 [Prevotella sp. P5-64]OYP68844.1 hypothetical protein CIK92_12970 [Prevotella sp. P4-67]OYP72032.1 hypothetical protein CIK94_11065 [Prevotella sp. P4-51]